MGLQCSRQIFEKYSDIKFHENPTSEIRVVRCGRTDGHKYMTKLITTFRIFADAPNILLLLLLSSSYHHLLYAGYLYLYS